MENYIRYVVTKYRHSTPFKPQLSPHKQRIINYGAKTQFYPDNDTRPNLDLAGIRRVQGIVGSLLYYLIAVNNKTLDGLRSIGTQHDAATEDTAAAVHQLLYYVAT